MTTQTTIVKIDEEYSKLIPPLTNNEFQELKLSIKQNGQSNSIIINQDGILLDGHNRFKILKDLHIEPQIVTKTFNNRIEEKIFIIDSHINRRHLNSFQKAELALKAKPLLEQIARQNSLINLKQNSKAPSEKYVPVGRVNGDIGKKAGISYATVNKVETIISKAAPDVLEKVRSGKQTISKAYTRLQKDLKRQEIVKEAANNSLVVADLATFDVSSFAPKLIHAEFQDTEVESNSINLIFTDPPYAVNQLPIYDDLAKLAARILTPGGSLVTYCNNALIPEIIQFMRDAGLTYHWILSVDLTAPFARYYPKGVVVKSKPLLWFTKGKRVPGEFLADRIESKPPDKNLHNWAQSTVEAEHVISRLTTERQTVLDPMMGAGTTGIAAISSKRNFVGIEKDDEHFVVAKLQLSMLKKVQEGGN